MSEPILFDPRIQTHYTVWHEDAYLEALVKDIMEKLKPDRFVETGSHMGWTLMWMAKRYPGLPIYSAEIDDAYFQASLHNCKPYPYIQLFKMNSPDFLRSILADNPLHNWGLTLFWLDAHWWPPVPLREECKVVSKLGRYVCLIDDFACKDPDFGGDVFEGRENNLSYVADIMGPRCWRPNYPSLPPYNKGYGLFLKGVSYSPPGFMKEDVL